jgi:hypothetical protein
MLSLERGIPSNDVVAVCSKTAKEGEFHDVGSVMWEVTTSET